MTSMLASIWQFGIERVLSEFSDLLSFSRHDAPTLDLVQSRARKVPWNRMMTGEGKGKERRKELRGSRAGKRGFAAKQGFFDTAKFSSD